MSEKQKLSEFVLDEAKKWTTRVIFAGVAAGLVYIFTPVKDRIAEIWKSPARLAAITEKLDFLATEIMRATGEDRVIHEAPGLSYVKEPVYLGDQITLNMVIRRTRTGAACTLLSRTALFTDESNISSAGDPVHPARQIGTAETPIRFVLDVPSQAQPGRITVYLNLEFDCGGKRVFDRTRPVAFMLLERADQ